MNQMVRDIHDDEMPNESIIDADLDEDELRDQLNITKKQKYTIYMISDNS